jgi:hypothetical protein
MGMRLCHSDRRWRKLAAAHQLGGYGMHASLAFVNGAGDKRRTPVTKADPEGLRLLNALLSTATTESPRPAAEPPPAAEPRPAVDKGKSKDERPEEEGKAETVSRPGAFPNDPDDPRNPNEVRERHLKKIKP